MNNRLFLSLYFSTLIFWVCFELYLVLRDVRKKNIDTSAEAASSRFFMPCIASAVLLAYISEHVARWRMSISQNTLLEISLFVMWAGLIIRVWSIRTLREFFCTVISVQDDQTIVTAGPYQYVRHPSYSGALCTFLGAAIATGSWMGLLIAPSIVFLGYHHRMNIEEQVLVSHFDKEYVDYMEDTKRIIPKVY